MLLTHRKGVSTIRSNEYLALGRVTARSFAVTRSSLRTRFIAFLGEFDPGSERTLAAYLTHASRTRIVGLAIIRRFEGRTGEEHVGQPPSRPGYPLEREANTGYVPWDARSGEERWRKLPLLEGLAAHQLVGEVTGRPS